MAVPAILKLGFGWALKHEALVGWAAIAAGALTLGGFVHHEHAAAVHARAQARATAVQTKVDAAAAAPAQKAAVQQVAVEARTARAAARTEQAAGADTPIPPAVLVEWAAGIDELRNSTGEGR